MLKRLLKVLKPGSGDRTKPAEVAKIDLEESGMRLREGVNLHRMGRYSEAERIYEAILKKSPRDPNALHLLSIIQIKNGNLDRAEELARLAVAENPGAPDYLNTLASILSEKGLPEEAVELLRHALHISPDAPRPRSNLLFLLNLLPGMDRRKLFQEHQEWARIHAPYSEMADSGPMQVGAGAFPRPGRRVRVGYLSADLRAHPVGRILLGVLPIHDPNLFDIFCYDSTREPDALNQALRAHVHAWRDVHGVEDDRVADLIAKDEIDVLVDLSGHTHGNRLGVFAQRRARVQATWLGYLNTSGMAQMDWRLTCALADPDPIASQTHSERIWYLPDCIWPWCPAPDWPAPGRKSSPTVGRQGGVIFGSFNTFRKVNSAVVLAWARILVRIPDSRLRIFGVPRGATVDRILDLFEAHGVGGERVELLGLVDHDSYHRAYSGVDIALDPFPYSGGATTCECLWMGVPVIALAGEGGFSRTSASLLSALGLQELVANDSGNYVDIAVALAGDSRKLDIYRSTLRDRMEVSVLMDVRRFVKNLEAAYLGMLRDQQHHGAGR